MHYVTFRHGSLTGKRRIRMRYRVEMAPAVPIVPIKVPAAVTDLFLPLKERAA